MKESMEKSCMDIVRKICATESTNCRSLNKSTMAMELLKLANVNLNMVRIFEIPLDINEQVVICFDFPNTNDNNNYELFVGIGMDGKFHFDLSMFNDYENEYGCLVTNRVDLPENYFLKYKLYTINWKIQLHELINKYLEEEIQPYKKYYTDIRTKQELACQMKRDEHEKILKEVMEILTFDF